MTNFKQMNSSVIRKRKRGLTRKYVSESLKKLHNSWQLCANFTEFDVICKELRINRDLTKPEEDKFREDRRAQGKTTNSSTYSNNQRLLMTSLKECIKEQESLKLELLRERGELRKEIYGYQILMNNCYNYSSRAPEHVNDVIMYSTHYITR